MLLVPWAALMSWFKAVRCNACLMRSPVFSAGCTDRSAPHLTWKMRYDALMCQCCGIAGVQAAGE